MLIFFKICKADLRTFFSISNIKKLLTVLFLLIVFPAFTLLYSNNPSYGAQKILNFIICSVPAVFAAYSLMNIKWDRNLSITALLTTAGIIIILLTSVLIANPFDQTTVYHYQPGRWSHVFIGRLTSFLTLILLFIMLNSKKRLVFLLMPSVIAGIILIYITGLRSAILGILIAGLIYLVYCFVKGSFLKHHYTALTALIIFISILIFSADYYLPGEIRTPVRINNMLNYENFGFGGEEGLQVRVKSAQLAWEMFLNSPLIGNGYGSFKGYNDIKWSFDQKYPHNIILEILAEFGIIGFFFFGYLFYSIIHSIKPVMLNLPEHIHPIMHSSIHKSAILTLFLFTFWLALFSKDLSSQSLIWIFLAAIGERKK